MQAFVLKLRLSIGAKMLVHVVLQLSQSIIEDIRIALAHSGSRFYGRERKFSRRGYGTNTTVFDDHRRCITKSFSHAFFPQTANSLGDSTATTTFFNHLIAAARLGL